MRHHDTRVTPTRNKNKEQSHPNPDLLVTILRVNNNNTNNNKMSGFTQELKRIAANDQSLSIINWNGAGIGNLGASLLFGSALRHNTSTIVLFLRSNDIAEINDSSTIYWGNVQLCYLSDNLLGDTAAAVIAASLQSTTNQKNNLRILHLASCRIHTASPFATLLESTSASIEQLDLSDNPLHEDSLVALAQALHHNTTLQRLGLRGSRMMTPRVVAAFVHALQHFNTTLLHMEYNCTNTATRRELDYWLALNRAGRQCWNKEGMAPRHERLSPSIWYAYLLEHCPYQNDDDPTALCTS